MPAGTFTVMKSHGDDKTNNVGSCAAQPAGIAQKVAVCLSPASLSLCAISLLRLVWLAACLALPALPSALHLVCHPLQMQSAAWSTTWSTAFDAT